MNRDTVSKLAFKHGLGSFLCSFEAGSLRLLHP